MNDQRSFENGKASLYLVATPIGNMDEFTPRAVDVLKSVDVIACEDTRTSGVLLKRFDISKRLISYQKFNEEPSTKGILALLEEGKNVALISDAGYPLINDPGQTLVPAIIDAGFNVIPVSGPNAGVDALVASGLVVQPFVFIGFLPPSEHARVEKMKEYASLSMTMVYYEAPHRIEKMLRDALVVFGDRKCCVARELTKVHEEFLRGTISEVLEVIPDRKGEMVVVIAGAEQLQPELDEGVLIAMVNEETAKGLSKNAAVKAVASRTGVARNLLYDLVHEKRN